MAGQAPGAGADKSPTKSVSQQMRDKLAAANIEIPSGDGGTGDNPFMPDAPAPQAAAPAAPAGAQPTGAEPQPGAAPAAGGTGDAPKSGDPAPGPDGADPQAAAPGAQPGTAAAPPAPGGVAVVSSATGQPVQHGAPAPQAELVTVEIEDEDTGQKFAVQVPKDREVAAKGGWMRRADYTRKTQELSRWKKQLEPLMQPDANGYTALDAVLPYINLANQNADYARAMVTLANQLQSGQPLSYGHAPAAPAQPAAGAPAAAGATGAFAPDASAATVQGVLESIVAQAGGNLDPLAIEAIRATLPQALATFEQRQNERFKQYDDRFAQIDQREQQAREQAQRAEAARQQSAAFAREAQGAMLAAFPNEFTGTDADFQRLGQIYAYAQRAGYVQQLGPMAAIFRAKADMDAAAREYTPSAAAAAAATAATAEANANNRAAAAAVAAGLGGGAPGGAAVAGQRTGPVTNINLKGADGKTPVKGSEFLRRFIQAQENA